MLLSAVSNCISNRVAKCISGKIISSTMRGSVLKKSAAAQGSNERCSAETGVSCRCRHKGAVNGV